MGHGDSSFGAGDGHADAGYRYAGAPDGYGDAGPDDPGLAWDAAESYAVRLLWQALPEARSVPPPAPELAAAAGRIRKSVRKWPYRQLARVAWGHTRLPGDDTGLWLDAAGALASMRQHPDLDSALLDPVAALRPADWAGAVIGVVRAGVNTPVTAGDLVRYVRECPDITPARDDGEQAYDPFASGAPDDGSLARGFDAVLLVWEAVGVVTAQSWLTGLGWWGLPRALARAWNGDFDAAGWATSDQHETPEGNWPGRAASPEELGIMRPPLGY